MLRIALLAALLGVCLSASVKTSGTVNIPNARPLPVTSITQLEDIGDVMELRDQILANKVVVDDLMADLMIATEQQDLTTVESVRTSLEAMMPDLMLKWDMLSQILNVTADLEDGLDLIKNRWGEFVPVIQDHFASQLAEGVPHMELPHNPISLPPNPFLNTQTAQTGTQTDKALLQAEDLRKAVQTWSALKKNMAEIKTGFKELELAKRGECSDTRNLNLAVTDTLRVKTASDNGATCSERVKNNANDVKTAITRFHTLRQRLDQVDSGLDGLNTVLIPLSRAPYVGAAASTIKNLIAPMRRTLDTYLPKVRRVDNRLYPTWRDRFNTLKTRATQAKTKFQKVSKLSEALSGYLITGRDCVCWMSESSIKSNYRSQVDPNIIHPWRGNYLSSAISGYEDVTDVCNSWDNFVDQIMNAMQIPSLNNVLGDLDGLFNALGPLFDIFGEINIALGQRLCMPNPIEATREGAERVREAGERAAEWASERWEEGREALTSWRRKRSVRKMFLTREEAKQFLSGGLIRSTRASDICFSVQDIIDGISSVFDFLLGWAQQILDEILNRINFSIPGLPNLNFMNLDFLDGLSFPTWNINFDLDLDLPYLSIPVPNLGIPNLSLNLPDFTVPNFNLNWNPPTYNFPQHVCQPLGKK